MNNINSIAQSFWVKLATMSIAGIKSTVNIRSVRQPTKYLRDSIAKVKNISVSPRDFYYYFTTWNNEEKMLGLIYKILKNFKWVSEKYDCDDRAKLVSALHSILFELNSCGEVYCKVTDKNGKTIAHWANIVVTSDGSVYLFDMSNQGIAMKLEPGKYKMGKWEYEILNARF